MWPNNYTGLDIHPKAGDIRTVRAVGCERLAHGLGACHVGAARQGKNGPDWTRFRPVFGFSGRPGASSVKTAVF